MARYERIVNNIATTLNGAINDSVTSVTVTDGSSYPSEGDYRILVDTEVMQVTARSSNVLTVVRGVDGTTAASHADASNVNVSLGAVVYHTFSPLPEVLVLVLVRAMLPSAKSVRELSEFNAVSCVKLEAVRMLPELSTNLRGLREDAPPNALSKKA